MTIWHRRSRGKRILSSVIPIHEKGSIPMSSNVVSPTQETGAAGENQYGVSNLEYDIVTTMSNLLQSQEVLKRYAKDAEDAGDLDTAVIFREIQDGNRRYVQQLRNALVRHFSS